MKEHESFYTITPKPYREPNKKREPATETSAASEPNATPAPQPSQQHSDARQAQQASANKGLISTGIALAIALIGLLAFASSFESVHIEVEPGNAVYRIGTGNPQSAVSAENSKSPALSAVDGWSAFSFMGNYYMRNGHYLLAADAQGYDSNTFPFEVKSQGNNHFVFALQKKPGNLVITVDPPKLSARASLGGSLAGTAPGAINKIPAGDYLLTVDAEDYYPSTQNILIEGMGKTQTVHIVLKPRVTKEKSAPKPSARPKAKQVPAKPQTLSRAQLEKAMGLSFVVFPVQQQQVDYSKGRKVVSAVLTRPFAISRAEITNIQFRQFLRAHSSGQHQSISLNTDQQPVVRVSWTQAALFANWLSSKVGIAPFYKVQNGRVIGFNPASTGYRLPSEVEWVYALDAGNKRYYWGDRFDSVTDKSGNYADVSAAKTLIHTLQYYNDKFVVSAPVGSFYPNRHGLYDMEGNVAEWMHDVFTTLLSQETVNPLGLQKGVNHTVRGGSWKYGTQRMLKPSYRQYHPDQGKAEVGFRLAYYIQ